MMPKKILDLRCFSGLPKFLVFTDENGFYQPYSSWDSVNNSKRLVEINMYRRYDVIFSSWKVRIMCMQAISRYECVKAHCTLDTAPCVVHLFDVIEPDTFINCCKFASVTPEEYVLVIHEVAGVYQIFSFKGTEVFGYLMEDLTYERRRFCN